MVIKTQITIDNMNIAKLQKLCESHTFSVPTPLFYQNQIPIVAYLVIDGIVNLTKNKKLKSAIKPGGIIGVGELINNTKSSVTAEAQSNSTVCYLDRSTVQDILNNTDSELAILFQDFFETQTT